MADYWRKHNDEDMKAKVKYEMVKAAIAVMAEAAETEGHAARIVYAGKILDGSASVENMVIGVIMNDTIKAKVSADTDYSSDLAFVINSLFNAYAGVAN